MEYLFLSHSQCDTFICSRLICAAMSSVVFHVTLSRCIFHAADRSSFSLCRHHFSFLFILSLFSNFMFLLIFNHFVSVKFISRAICIQCEMIFRFSHHKEYEKKRKYRRCCPAKRMNTFSQPNTARKSLNESHSQYALCITNQSTLGVILNAEFLCFAAAVNFESTIDALKWCASNIACITYVVRARFASNGKIFFNFVSICVCRIFARWHIEDNEPNIFYFGEMETYATTWNTQFENPL